MGVFYQLMGVLIFTRPLARGYHMNVLISSRSFKSNGHLNIKWISIAEVTLSISINIGIFSSINLPKISAFRYDCGRICEIYLSSL